MIVHCPNCYHRFATDVLKDIGNLKISGGDHYVQDPKTRMYSLKEKLD